MSQLDTIEFSVSSGMGETGTKVCLNVTAKNFVNVESMQFNISYDGTLVVPECPASYVHPDLANNIFGDIFNCNSKDNGYINFVWASDPTTIADGEIIFTLCFNLIGDPGNKSPVNFNGLLLDLEICQVDLNGKQVCTDAIKLSNASTIMIISNTLEAFYNKCDADGLSGIENALLTFYATGGKAPYTYTVKDLSNATLYSGVLNQDGERITINNIPQGNYNILFTDANGLNFILGPVNISNNQPLSYDPPIIKNPTCSDRKNGFVEIPQVVGGVPPYTYKWSNFINGGSGFEKISDLAIGTYTVTITDFNGCKKSDTFILKLDTLKLDLQISREASCKEVKNGRITINAIGGMPWKSLPPYEYSLNGNNWIKFTPPININNIASGNFTFTIRDSLFCDTDIKTFTMPADRKVKMSVDKKDISCNGLNDGRVSMSATPYSVDYTFLPLIGYPNLGTPKTDTFSVGNLMKGNYGYRAVDADGCKDTIFFSIIEPDTLKLNPTILQPDCTTSGSVSFNPTGGVGSFTYLWDPVQAGNPASISNLTGGTFSVTVTDGNNCTATFSTTLNQQGSLSLTPQLIKPVSCTGMNDATLRVDILGPITNGPYTFVWKNASNQVISNMQTVINTPPGSYSVTVTDKNGCSNTNSINVIDAVPINYTVNVTNAKCNKEKGKAIVNISGNPAGYSYEWYVKGTTSPIIDRDNTLDTIAGDYLLSVINSNNCRKDTIITITEPAPLTFPAPSVNKATCFGLNNGQAGILNAPAGMSFKWSSGGQPSPFIINLPVGKYWVLGLSGTCQSDTVFFDVGTFPKLILDDSKTVLINPTCFGSKNGSVFVEASGGSGIGYTYNWPSLNNNSSNAVANLGAGGYEVVIKDDKNCEYKDTLFLTQPDKLETFLDRVKTVELDCNNQDGGRIALTTIGGNPGIKTFTWQQGVDAEKETALNLSAGTYCSTISDNKGCKDTFCYTLVESKPLKGEINTPLPPSCNGGATCISVKYITGGTGNKYTFQINNGTRYPVDSCVTVFAGAYFINLIDSAGCSIDTLIRIAQPDPVSVNLGPDKEIQLGLPSPVITAVIDSQVLIDTLKWTPTTFLKCIATNCQTVELTPSETTTYLLTVTDVNGCTGTDDIVINVKDVRNVYFANIFSPNKDGSNDFFQVVTGPGVEKILTFTIYDRWGNKVFEKNNYVPDPAGSDGWDGTFNGNYIDPGVFVYYSSVQFIDGKIIEYAGSVTVIDKVKN